MIVPAERLQALTDPQLDAIIEQLKDERTRRRRRVLAEVVRVEGDMRVIRCSRCTHEFRSPRRRGRAPRTCPSCRSAPAQRQVTATASLRSISSGELAAAFDRDAARDVVDDPVANVMRETLASRGLLRTRA